MARLALTLPETFPFATEIDVRITDLNYGGHLGNDALVSLLHEARARFLGSRGLSERNAGGASLIMSDLAVVYRAEVFAGDRLRIEVALGDFSRVGCDVFYKVTRAADQQLVAQAKTGVVFLDPQRRRPTAVPDAVRALGPAQ
jgi:acyl-CoA thioesterase FadM